MTTPRERTMALNFAAEFMRKVRDMPEVPDSVRQEADAILRHYPSNTEVSAIAGYVSATDPTGSLLASADR